MSENRPCSILGFWFQIPVRRRWRIALFSAAVLLVLVVLWAARSVFGLYLIGLLLAYILAPLVRAIEQGFHWLADKSRLRFLHRIARSAGIVVGYLILLGVIAGFVALVIPVVVREAEQLWATRDVIWFQVSTWGARVIEMYDRLPQQVRLQIDAGMRNLTSIATTAVQQALRGTFSAISYTTGVVLAVIVVPFWTFFLLRDYEAIRESVYRFLPSVLRDDVGSILQMLDHTIGSYLRGQVILMLTIGAMQTLALTLLGVDYALLLGVLAGLLEVIPNVGPTVAAVPAILVALVRSPGLALLTAGAVNLIQNIENAWIAPRVLGSSLGLHPVVMMAVLVVGTEIGGFPGLLLAPILTAMLRDVFHYLTCRFADTPCSSEEALARVLAREPFTVQL